MADSEFKKLLCDFKTYSRERRRNKMPYHIKCQACGKKFELNSGLFIDKNETIICKKCYKKASKGIL